VIRRTSAPAEQTGADDDKRRIMADEPTDTPEGTDPEVTPTFAAALKRDSIEQVDLQLEMQRSYLDYAMSVIVGRALPRSETVSSPCTAG
jgi:hypothetical protein